MKKIFTLVLSISFLFTQAQIGGGWDWAFNTGAMSPSIKHMAYQGNGELRFVGYAAAAAKFGSTTLTAPKIGSFPGNILYVGKIATSGAPTILKSYANPNFSIDCATTDSSGNFYLAGSISGTYTYPSTADFGNGITYTATANIAYIAKLDANGNAQWVKPFTLGGTGSVGLQVHRIAVSKLGNIFFVGFNANTTVLGGKVNAPIYKLDNNGNTLWFKDALNASNYANFQEPKASFNDKFIDDNENVHLTSYNLGQTFSFNNALITAPLVTVGGATYFFHISLDANGNNRFANGYRGSGGNFYVDRVSGNCLMIWGQYEINAGPFATLPTYTIGNSANYYSGYLQFKSDGTTLIKSSKALLTGLFKEVVFPKSDGSLVILNKMDKIKYGIGTDYLYPLDNNNYAVGIFETDANWEVTKFISGGKSAETSPLILAVNGNEYALVSSFNNAITGSVTSTSPLPTTSFGTTTLTGFNAATDLTTAYGVFSTSASVRADVAFAKCNSANFPVIGTTTWLGANTNWNDAANWTNGVPTNSVKAVFNGSSANYPTTFTSPTSGTLQVNAGATITLPTTLTITGGIKNEGTVKINNAGFFQGFGATEWKGNGAVEFLGTAAIYLFMSNPFTNAIVLNSSVTSYYDMAIKGITFNATSGKFDMGNKTITITDPSTTSIIGANTNNYFFGGTLKRSINTTGTYEFPVGSSSNFQSATVTTNGLVGVSNIAVTHTSGAITGTTPNTSLNGVLITTALNAGWFSVTPNLQSTSGTYNISLNLKASTNSVTDAGKYVVIKRDNSTTAWSVQGTYNLATVNGTTVSATTNGLTSFSDFAIGMGTTTLPVNFTSFTAKSNGTTAQLNWATVTEVNNKGFNVQHSVDGVTYSNLGFVSGNGNSIQNNNYSFTHYSPSNGNNYYRLQQVDNDGKLAYSPVQVVNFNQLQTALTVYPNPVVTTINFNKNFTAGTTLQIINSMGQVVENSAFTGNRYQPKTPLKGMYKVVIVEANNNRSIVCIIAQ